MKHLKIQWLFLFAIVAVALVVLSCDDEDSVSAPSITSVKITDPEKGDSTFTQAFPGALVVIHGNNFSGLKKIAFNGISIPFNPNYVLDNSVIVQIPSNLPFKGKDPTLPNTIEVTNSAGSASFDFKFLAPEPELSVFKFNPPAVVGKEMQIIGKNFYLVEKIQFEVDGEIVAEVTDFTVNEDYDVITFTIPAGATQDGIGRVITESGEAESEFLSSPVPQFLKLSDDVQPVGAPITISGKYFAFIDRVEFPGGIVVEKEDLTFNSLFTEITLTVPEGVSGIGPVNIYTEFDTEMENPIESPITFNDKSGIIRNWEPDGSGNIGWDWGKGTVETANGIKPPYVGDGKYQHFLNTIDPNVSWWWDPLTLVVSFNSWPTITGVTDDTPISQIGLAFNYFTVNTWDKGNWRIQFGWNSGNAYEFKPWATETVKKDRWVTYTIPLSTLITATGQTKWSQVKAAFNPADNFLFMQFQNPGNNSPVDVNAFWDNVRFVKLP